MYSSASLCREADGDQGEEDEHDDLFGGSDEEEEEEEEVRSSGIIRFAISSDAHSVVRCRESMK